MNVSEMKADCGLALWYMDEPNKTLLYYACLYRMDTERMIGIIPNHEDRIQGLGEKYGFGTPPLVTPSLKTHVKALFGDSIMDNTLYLKGI